MGADFSRDSFDPLRRFSRVLQQQGRIHIDSDDNERNSIQLHLVRTLAADLIGPYGGHGDSFKIDPVAGLKNDFQVGEGHYYVDGWLLESDRTLHYRGDADHPGQSPESIAPEPDAGTYVAYLDAWERHVSAAEYDSALPRNDPGRLAEVALAGPDTSSRAQVAWRVRLTGVDQQGAPANPAAKDALWQKTLTALDLPRGRLTARAVDPGSDDTPDPCVVAPTSAYRGVENQLYRIEVQKGGFAGEATFTWSRENASILFQVDSIEGVTLRLKEGWRDSRFGLKVGDFVELEGPAQRAGDPGPIYRIAAYHDETLEIELDSAPDANAANGDLLLRRWDHQKRPASAGTGKIVDGAIQVVEDQWINLEDGISVRFEKDDANPAVYRAGDYWLVPARTALGDILWPSSNGVPSPIPPNGVDHHLAPLALVAFAGNGDFQFIDDLRRPFRTLTEIG